MATPTWQPNARVFAWKGLLAEIVPAFPEVSVNLMLALIQMESGGNKNAYRFEPGYYHRLLANNKQWQEIMHSHNYKPEQVSASYGLGQLMYPTAWGMGYRAAPEGLYDPKTNLTLACKYLSAQIRRYKGNVKAALAHYNGGGGGAKKFLEGVTHERPCQYAIKVWSIYEHYEEYNSYKGPR